MSAEAPCSALRETPKIQEPAWEHNLLRLLSTMLAHVASFPTRRQILLTSTVRNRMSKDLYFVARCLTLLVSRMSPHVGEF